jgi:hypothetical protein
MDSNQHDHDDPTAPAARPHRGPSLDGDDDRWDERRVGGDLLVGADPIRTFLVYLGMPPDVDVYYLRRCGRWPIGNSGGGAGGRLVASKRRLIQHIEKLTRGTAA